VGYPDRNFFDTDMAKILTALKLRRRDMRACRQNIDSARLAGKIFRSKELAPPISAISTEADWPASARTVPVFLFLISQ
jgi:hypothetical protein